MNSLSQVLFWQADDGARLYGGHFGGIDVFTAAEDEVRSAVGEERVTHRIQPADIAQRFPVARTPGFCTDVEIAWRGVLLRPQVDFAHIIGAEFTPVLPDDLHFADYAAANRAWPRDPLGPRDDRHRPYLRPCVKFEDALGAKPFDPC